MKASTEPTRKRATQQERTEALSELTASFADALESILRDERRARRAEPGKEN